MIVVRHNGGTMTRLRPLAWTVLVAAVLLLTGCAALSAKAPVAQPVSLSRASASASSSPAVAPTARTAVAHYPDPRGRVLVLEHLDAPALRTSHVAKAVWATTTEEIAWPSEPAGDVSDGVVHAEITSVDVRTGTVSFDASQIYKGATAETEAERDGTFAGDSDYVYVRDAHQHVQRARLSSSAIILLQMRAGGLDYVPPASRTYGRMFGASISDLAKFYPRGAYPDFWVVMRHGKIAALVEMFQS